VAFVYQARLAAAAMAVLALCGCKEIQVENGEVPSQYQAAAQKYLGVYQGQMDGVPGTMTISLQGNKAAIQYSNKLGTDILNPKCASLIGDLKSVRVSEDGKGGYNLDSAVFSFDANRCASQVEGRELVMNFKSAGSVMKLSASILRSSEWQTDCRPEGFPPAMSCSRQPVYYYVSGKFTRQQ
jgi:hypothetical protein